MMTVYEKLVNARIGFQNANIKQSGKNDFAKYTYFELSDILPVVNALSKELGFVSLVSFGTELATLSFVCTETGDKIEFTSPMSKASLKGCHDVQNLGAVETYIRRYLYQTAFEIVESDGLDKSMNPNEKPQNQPQRQKQAMPSSVKQGVENIGMWLNRLTKEPQTDEVKKLLADKNIEAIKNYFARGDMPPNEDIPF